MWHWRIEYLCVGCLALRAASSAPAATIYVNHAATGSNNGTSWTNAYTDLQDGLADCTSGDQIWVAAGTYVPDDCSPSCDRSSSFTLVEGCDLLGGFAGTETTASQRNPDSNVTILSGDNLGNDPTVSDNAHQVVYAASDVDQALFDGFSVTGGYYDDDNWGTCGGMWCLGALNVTRITFTGNYAAVSGGGLCADSNAHFDRCRFTNNSVPSYGAGGGAIVGNYMAPSFTNCLFVGNDGGLGGGAVFVVGHGSPRFENCTITGNSLGELGSSGKGLYHSSGNGVTTIVNSIVWNNGSGTLSEQLFFQSSSNRDVTYTDIQSCTSGTCYGTGLHNLNANPNFDSGYLPTGGSAVIDSGNNSEVTTSLDLVGSARIMHCVVDMGARETSGFQCAEEN